MTHYRMLDRAPSVVITSNRNELKLYQDNVVFLNDGDNFELRFFNPLPQKIGVQINFNGINKGDGYLVLNPGQDLILDRFLDEQRKMLFETYVVDGNNEAAVKAIEKNGVITFNFFKEYYNNNSYKEDVKINYDFPPKPHVYNNNYVTNNYYGSTSGHAGSSGSQGYAGTSGSQGCAGSPGIPGMAYSNTALYTANLNGMGSVGGTFTTTSSTNFNSRMYKSPGIFQTEIDESCFSSDYSEYVAEQMEKNINYSEYVAEAKSKPLETGRIEKGDISNQKLKGVQLQFASTPFYTTTYKIMPASSMSKTIGEIRQYCPECGYRLRKTSWSFCPKCGEKL